MSAEPQKNRGPVAGPANRRALIAAGREVFADRGYSAPLNAVARRAGVGQGSLYRHFPDRTALAVAIFDENINQLELLAFDSRTGLADLVDSVTEQVVASAALLELIASEAHDPRVSRLRDRFEAVIGDVLQREQGSRQITAQVETDDVMIAVSMLALLLAGTGEEQRQEVARRARAIFRSAFRRTSGAT